MRPGDVVVDLGAGTGILSVFAARAGAARLYALERTSMVEAAERVVADSGAADRVVCIRADADHVDLREPCDVLVSECIGAFGIFPCHEPRRVRAGDSVAVHIAAELHETSVTWRWRVLIDGREIERHGPGEGPSGA